MTSLTLKKITKSFGEVETIHGTDLVIESGEFVVFVGPSGCGKSTLLRMIAGLEEVTSGDILIGAETVTRVDAANRGIAMVFQSYALYPHMTVRENLSFGLKNMKMSKENITRKVENAADILKLTEYLERLPSHLSGGQRQRVAIGRAIVRDPGIFLFDEPLSNLDAELRVEMRQELIKLHRSLGSTMIYVTHDQVEAMTMADRIVILKDGHVVQTAPPLEIYNHPVNTFAAGFIGSPRINLLDGKIIKNDHPGLVVEFADESRLALQVNLPTLSINDKITMGIRPEHVSEQGPNDAVALRLSLTGIESLGDVTYLFAKVFDGLNFTVKLQGQHSFNAQSVLTLKIDPRDILFFDAQGVALEKQPVYESENVAEAVY